MKRIIAKLIPPLLFDIKHAIVPPKPGPHEIVWSGDYATWKEATENSTGYDADVILKTTTEAILKVKNGEAVYERDSVVFNKAEYSWPLITWLLKIGIEKNNIVNVLDFGGSLGSSYFQNRNLLKPMKLKWSVCEQDHYISVGNEKFADESLKFFHSVDECINERHPDILLLSGTIQCLDEPFVWLDRFMSKNFEYIIFDRTAFHRGPDHRLTVQKVPETIYKASYPSWFFNFQKFVSVFKDKYELLSEFDGHLDTAPVGYYRGLVFKRKK